MRETQVLLAQHIGRMIKFQWFAKGKVKVFKTSTEKVLKSRGYEVTDIQEFLMPPEKKLGTINFSGKEQPEDKSHPHFEQEPCLMYRDDNVPILGLEQAKVLTKTVQICEGMPEPITESEKKLTLSDKVHSEVKKKIKLCCMLEATQKVLPKRKDPLRPAWNFPREYGINDSRKNELLCKNLAMVCEQFTSDGNNKSVILDGFFSAFFKAHNSLIQFEATSELIITAEKKLKKFAEPSATHELVLPDLYPVYCTVSLNPYNFYVLQDIYPLNVQSKWPYVQIAFLHFNETQVKNITEAKITESQIQARSLLKSFTIAVAEARALFGSKVKTLPEPIVVPVVQTNGKLFYFGIFQLNTLDLDNNSKEKNIFWNSVGIPLYESCEYEKGRPLLKGYNQELIRKLITFYNIE